MPRSSMAEADLFAEYLLCGLPDGYPVKEIPLGPDMTGEQKKALIIQQTEFLRQAHDRFEIAPALTYVAAMKHFGLMQVLGISADSFTDEEDQSFFHHLEDAGLEYVAAAQAALDEDTAFYCDRLVAIQSFAQILQQSRLYLAQMIESGAKALGPEPPKPRFLAGIFKKENQATKANLALRENFQTLAATFELDTDKMAADLEFAHAKIDGFLRERSTLENQYLTPFLQRTAP